MKIAIVTGASSGIGREFVYQIEEKYRNLDEIWVIARSKDKLEDLKKDITCINVRILSCDLTKESDMDYIDDMLKHHKADVKLLVNASGYGMIGKFMEVSMEDNVGMCDLNITSLTKLTYMVVPYMKKNASIINIASSAAFSPQPSFSVYAATKSYVYSFSLALRRELRKKGINVLAVCPGPVDTNFFNTAEKYKSIKLYKKIFKADPKKVVKKALIDNYHKKAVSVYGVSMKGLRILSKIIPYEIVVKFFK